VGAAVVVGAAEAVAAKEATDRSEIAIASCRECVWNRMWLERWSVLRPGPALGTAS